MRIAAIDDFRTQYKLLVMLVHRLPSVKARGPGDKARHAGYVLKGPVKMAKKVGRWSIYADACIICGSTHVSHWKMGICNTCKFRIREMEGYSRRLGILPGRGRKEVIIYMPTETVEKAQTLATILHCKRAEVDEMAIDFMYEFMMGLIPEDNKDASRIDVDGLVRLLYRMRVAIVLEGTKKLAESLSVLISEDKKRDFTPSYLPHYQQVGGAILTSMYSKEKL